MDRSLNHREPDLMVPMPDLLNDLVSPVLRNSPRDDRRSAEALAKMCGSLQEELAALAREIAPHVREFCEANHESLRIVEAWVLPKGISIPGWDRDPESRAGMFQLSVVIVTPDMRYRSSLVDAVTGLDIELHHRFADRDLHVDTSSTFRRDDDRSFFAEQPDRERSAIQAFHSDRKFGPLPEDAD